MTHTFYKKCSEKPRRIGRRNASHTFYKKCARGRGAAVSRAYVSKVLRGEEVNFTFASALRFAHALQMDFIPQMAVPSFDESPSTSNSHSNSNLSTVQPFNLSTPNLAMT